MDRKPRNQQWVITIVLVLSLLVLVTIVQVDPAAKFHFYDPVLAQQEAMMKMGMDPALMGLDPMDPMYRGGTTVIIADPGAAEALFGHRFGGPAEQMVSIFDEEPPQQEIAPASEEAPPTAPAEQQQQQQAAPAGEISATPPDADSDGVEDSADLCSNTPTGETVNAAGCPDSDGDGIYDDTDSCPNTAPTGNDADGDGCTDPLDADGDGITDSSDNCPNAANPDQANWDSDSAGDACDDSDGDTVWDNIDDNNDNDGIIDVYDSCPNTPAGETADSAGCSDSQIDSDNDLVMDADDQCPNTPTGEAANSAGCSASQTDTDGDGVYDSADQCPNEAATAPDADGDGCTDPLEDLDAPTGLVQGAAVVEQLVNWTNPGESTVITTTPAPTLTETEVVNNEKSVTVSARYNYQNVLTYATIPNKEQSKINLYWMIDGVRTDVTNRADFNVTFYDEDSDGLVDKISWITPHLSTQEFVISFETEIGVVLQIYLEEEHNFNSGPYPIDNNIIITVENSTVEGEVMTAGELDILITLPDGTTTTQTSTEWTFSEAGTETISALLTRTSDSTINGSETRSLNIYNGLNPSIEVPADNTEITPDVAIRFEEASTSLTEPITSWALDFGDASSPWGTLGIMGSQQACFSSTNMTNSCVSGILKNSDTQGDPCGCSAYTPSIYPTTTIETNTAMGVRYHTYKSEYDCGTDRICPVTLTVSSENYTATDTINLKFEQPEEEINDTPSTTAEICAEFPNLAMCQPTPPVPLDTTFDPMTTETRGQTNFVAQNPATVTDTDPLGGGADEPEGSGIGGIVITLLLLSALAGGGFFMWKRGMFEKLKARFQKKSIEPTTTQPATTDTTQQSKQPSISDYISKAKTAGESDVVIRQNLKNSGWSEDEINKNL